MSDSTLTPDAPGDGAAAALDGVAPATGSEVTGGSAETDLSNYVEKSRFDGLMGTYNREKDTWLKERQQYEAELASLRNPTPTQEEAPVADDTALSAVNDKVDGLVRLLMEERLKNARHEAVEQYPEAKPFADMLVGSTPEEVMQAAANVAERAKTLIPAPVTPAGDGTPAPEGGTAETPPAAPVTGGTVAVEGNPSAADKVAQAIANRDWSAFLAAKVEDATAETQLA